MYIKANHKLPSIAASAAITEEIEGVVLGHRDGHGFVQRDDDTGDIYLSPNEMRAVLHRDRVRVRVIRLDRKGRPEGRVTEILERPTGPIIGRLLQEGGVYLVAPEDKRYGQDVLIPKNGIGHAKTGQVVVVQLTEPPSLYGQPVGCVTEVLGEMDDPGMEIDIAVRKYSVPHVFSEAALDEARKLPDKVRAADKKGRVDLTDVPLVTIDGEDARDFDDAVYCESAKVGRGKGWRLLVAIADVSHYVQNGTPIDSDAFERATSVYFPRRVIPMLPEKLSNGLCSLNPHVERLCMVCDMLVSAKGDVQAYQFYPAVMFSHARFTYTEVAAILANTGGSEAKKRKQSGFDSVPHLLNLSDVYRALLSARSRRGAIDLDTVETHIVCDESGQIEKIIPRTRNEAHKLIEEAMLAANVCSADFILKAKKTGLFRVHEGPTPEKRDILQQYLRSMGVHADLSDEPSPAEFQAISHSTKERPEAQQIHTMLLRSMSQAIYTPFNSGHFGLAYEAYTHFTSPIRRYPDLLVHRVIKAILHNTAYKLPTLPTPGEATEQFKKRLAARKKKNEAFAQRSGSATVKPSSKKASAEQSAWEAAGLHCSANERRADEASKDVEAWLKCKYMKKHLGEEYAGTVTAATSFGLFVTLDAMYVEGLVHITELGGEYFRFDEVRQELRGERTGIRYALGSRVRVQVSRVDLDGRKIDFRLIREGEVLRVGGRGASDAKVSAAPVYVRLDLDQRATGRPTKKSAKSVTQSAKRSASERVQRNLSPIAALKAAVKKAAKKGVKPKRSRK